jgi:hypothetical protein
MIRRFEMSRIEPMKQRFKKKFPYKTKDDMHFDDDIDDYGKTNKDYIKKRNGRKPKWRDERKQMRKFKWGG